MRQLLALPLAVALLILLSGCTQSVPSQCANLPSDSYAGCVYRNAVIAQNPFDCYSIKDMAQRKTCIKDASDSAMKKKLESMAQPEQEAQLYGQKPAATQLPATPAPSVNNPTTPNPTTPGPAPATPTANATDLDMQIYTTAVQANDIQFCEQISDTTILQSCISQVARQQKNITMCDSLSTKDRIDLCKLYSMGESNK